MNSALGRSVAIAAVAIKFVLLVAGFVLPTNYPAVEFLDKAINFFLIVVAAIWLYRRSARGPRSSRSTVLWPVRRQLLLSYILIGAIPILLLITFSMVVFLLVFFDVSTYLVQNRFTDLVQQASTFARTTLYEVEQAPDRAYPEIVRRRQAAINTRFPGSTIEILPTIETAPCGLSASEDLPASKGALPQWVACEGFSGLIEATSAVARAVALPTRSNPKYAVVVDVPVDKSLAASLDGTGIELGQRRTIFNTATFLTYTDWPTGVTHLRPLAMSVNIPTLYNWLGRSQSGALSFNRVLLFLMIGLGGLLLVIVAVALGNGLALARSISASVDDLFRGTERVKEGHFEHVIAVRSDDQLGELARSFNDMTGQIQGLLRLEEELRIARAIQMSLLPPQGELNVPGLAVSGMCKPAREVGGDYYDVLPLEGGRIGLLIADVAGKGTSAALYMAELKGLMLSLSRMHTSPRELLIEADQIMRHHLNSGSFITMIYAIIDLNKAELTCARAGHTPFIRIPSAPRRKAEVLTPDGMVLGLNLDNGEHFRRALVEVTIPLQKEDLFFFYTDGISEAMDRDGECFGEAKLSTFLERHAELPSKRIGDLLFEEVEAFAAGQLQHDDITMIILKVE